MGHFRNIIVCEDVREELGNKKSLMGVFGGDIVVLEFPVTLQLAFYIEYVPDSSDTNTEISFEFRMLMDDQELVKGKAVFQTSPPGNVAGITLPKGLANFDKECRFRLLVTEAGKSEIELVSKRILRGLTVSSDTVTQRRAGSGS